MNSLSRRRALGLIGSLVAGSLAGCTDDEPPEFLVTDTAFSLQPGGDINVQVTVENGFENKQESTVEVILRYEPEDGDSEQWTKTEPLALSGATEIQRQYLFEEVHDENDSLDFYDIDAQLLDAE